MNRYCSIDSIQQLAVDRHIGPSDMDQIKIKQQNTASTVGPNQGGAMMGEASQLMNTGVDDAFTAMAESMVRYSKKRT